MNKRFHTSIRHLITIGLLSGMVLQASAQYTGKVFVDENQNGVLDQEEKCLPRVAVSDGLNVVQTDAEGIYQLPGHARMHALRIHYHPFWVQDSKRLLPSYRGESYVLQLSSISQP